MPLTLLDLTHFDIYNKYILLNFKEKIYQGEWFRNILFFLINEVLMTFSKLEWLQRGFLCFYVNCFGATGTRQENQWLVDWPFIFMWKIHKKSKSSHYFLPFLFYKWFKMICRRISINIKFRVIRFRLKF